jgi:hypothetical protein
MANAFRHPPGERSESFFVQVGRRLAQFGRTLTAWPDHRESPFQSCNASPQELWCPSHPGSEFGGDRYDLQDLMWDVQGAVTRAVDTICLANTFRSDLWDADIAFQRERLETSTRSVVNGTDEWGEKYADGQSPFDDIYAELRNTGAMKSKSVRELEEDWASSEARGRTDKRSGRRPNVF